jgi:hypothetical protein
MLHTERISKSARFSRLRKMSALEVCRPHITNTRRLRNIVANVLDVRVQPQYDFWRVPLNTATVATVLFSIGQGGQYTPPTGTAITKTAWHTSMVTGQQQLDAPKKLLVKNISIMGDPSNAPVDVIAASVNYLTTFNMLQKIYWQGHLQKLPAGAGVFVSGGEIASATGPTNAGGSWQGAANNGYPTAQNYQTLCDLDGGVADAQGNTVPPITGVLIEQGQVFNVTVDPTQTSTPGTGFTTSNLAKLTDGILSNGLTFWAYLEGISMVAVN